MASLYSCGMAGKHESGRGRWDLAISLLILSAAVWLLDLDGNLLFGALLDLWRITA